MLRDSPPSWPSSEQLEKSGPKNGPGGLKTKVEIKELVGTTTPVRKKVKRTIFSPPL